ncbi:bis(5'-nucleosyl)-tetraphosphatase (symmetrical) YqeK [Streptococcus pacificus]|uniref:bis(5'-nucleosyl)-tetraphosphatase (symmetrical) n=1 Tax=Streptococcus pacificus TaxID=2740577 RepID=A0ABS0ZLT5_9STRE|nr:bis(5'-nucleosyl)-tetraphosphatase (symmetrical) YqeK [Streptococcus pacificus]MBJ8326431.1 bis(5'-nucleosyl)-tetraphosphatase (symmetrical) YqeK [Streptococcus pacificus]
MTYRKYLNMSRDQLIKKLEQVVTKERLMHMIGVEETCIHLALLNDYDTEKAGLAGLLHDYAKNLSDAEFLRLIKDYQLDETLKQWNNNIWHGFVGIYKIQEDLGLTDKGILQAIKYHTTGSSQMSLLDKIVYVADYIEPNRDFPGVDEARNIAEVSLDKAVAYETAQTISYLVKKRLPIHPQTLQTYNAYVHHLNEE